MFPFLPIRVCVGFALMGKLIAKTVIGITKITLVDFHSFTSRRTFHTPSLRLQRTMQKTRRCR